jgi:RNA polymerase sigma factor for flagellar operon FliA
MKGLAPKISEQIWQRYANSKDMGLRNEILMAYLPIFIRSLMKSPNFFMNQNDVEDMASQGVLELINCINRYDVKRGIQFDSYASIRWRGAIIDYIRKKDWVSRDVRKKIKRINQTADELRIELGRFPEKAELADRMGITEAELDRVRSDEINYNAMPFEEALLSSDMIPMDVAEAQGTRSPEYRLLERDFRQQIARYVDELGEKERTVISLRYYEELKFKEIAFFLNLTVPRVSQIHSKALFRLRERIEEYMAD